jgi:hypothetical protein
VRARTELGLTRLRGLLDGTTDEDDEHTVEQLRRALAARGARATAPPDGLVEHVRDGLRSQRRHLAWLGAGAAFLVLVVLLVVLTV